MAKLSQIQGIKLSQNIALTPQLIQAIKLFELNNIELEEYIDREIIDNPFLDKDDGSNEKDNDKDYNENNLSENNSSSESEIHVSNQESPIDDQSNIFDNSYGGDNSEINNYIEETVSFKKSSKDFLIEQVNFAFKNELDRQIAFLLIDNLDSSGFLKISLKDFSIDIGIDENKVNKVLSELKKFEPIGVFSQSLEESFLLQLEDRKLLNNSIKKLINNLEILASGDLKKLTKICDTDEDEIFKMLKIIRSCNPRPLSSFDENDYDDIKEPDVIVKKVKSKWIVELNENTLPKVLVNTGYYEELASKKLTKPIF